MYEKFVSDYKNAINKLSLEKKKLLEENKILLEKINIFEEKLKLKENNYEKLEQQLKLITEENNSIKNKKEFKIVDDLDVSELNIDKLIQNEVVNIIKENIDYKCKTLSIENFTLTIYSQEIKQPVSNSEDLKLLSDNVDEILQNIQKKREKLLQCQKKNSSE